LPDERFGLQLDLGDSSTRAREVDAALQTLKVSTMEVAQAAEHARGEKRIDGRGLLGMSYAFQDFTTVLAMGGGLDRALLSISNNVDQVAIAAGKTAAQAAKINIAFTAFVAAMPLVEPAIKKVWNALAGSDVGGSEAITKALDAVNQKLASTEQRAKAIAESFERMAKAPTAKQAGAAKSLEKVITEAPTEAVVQGLTGAIGATELGAPIEPGLDAQIRALQERQALEQMPEARDRINAELQKLMLEARRRQLQANRNRAQAMMGQAVQPGAPGLAAQQQIAGLAQRFPDRFPAGFANEVYQASPEGIEAQRRFEKQQEAHREVQEHIKRRNAEKMREFEARNQASARASAEEAKRQAEATKEQQDRDKAANLRDVNESRENLDQQARVRDTQAMARSARVTPGRPQAPPNLGHLPLMNPMGTAQDTVRTILDTQQRMQQNNEQIWQMLQRQARAGNQRQRGNATGGLPQ
jgi:hypothetical protein